MHFLLHTALARPPPLGLIDVLNSCVLLSKTANIFLNLYLFSGYLCAHPPDADPTHQAAMPPLTTQM